MGHFKTTLSQTMHILPSLRIAFLAFGIFSNTLALAVDCTATSWGVNGSYLGLNNSGQGSSPEAACAALATAFRANPNWAYPASDKLTTQVLGTGNGRACEVTKTGSAPSPGFTYNSYPSCTPLPYVAPCTEPAGTAKIANWTAGYSRTPDGDDLDIVASTRNYFPANRQICSGGCVRELDTTNPIAAWQSQTPTDQGLYRWSIDLQTRSTGAACSPTSADTPVDKNAASPPCPGFVGDINGKKGCYGTASSPVNVVQGDRPLSGSKIPANPAAGNIPASGEGSGSTGATRTPSAGTGGASGGPSSAAVGPTGNTPTPATGTEQLNCGAPGQPKCRIDETGTGDGKTAFDSAKGDLTTNGNSAKSAIDGAASIQAPTWSFTFQLPTGCAAYNTGIKGFVMNPCSVQPVIHDLMSMIWAAVTAFFIIGLVGRTIREA